MEINMLRKVAAEESAADATPEKPPLFARLREKLPKKGRKLSRKQGLLVLAIIAGLAAAFGIYKLFFTAEEKIALTGTTTYGTLDEAIEGSGTTTPADSVTYDINGTVLEWYVSAGDEVQEGDLLYVLDSTDAEDDILDAEVELEELYEQLNELQENIAGQTVTADFSGRVENISAEAGKKVQSGATLCKLIDDSSMKATLYFSYSYEADIQVGTRLTMSVPDRMLALTGRVTDIQYVDYITSEGMKCFAVTVEAENPGSLTEGMTVTCWLEDTDGTEIYAATDAALEYADSETVTAGASGELTRVNVVDYQRVSAGQTLFYIDASGYQTQLETVQKQIDSYEEKIADLQESIATEYTRYSDISGRVVSASYSTNRMTGADVGSVVIYDQISMQISVNIDELDADRLTQGMDVTVYRETSSNVVYYDATLSYLSLEATSNSSGVSTFAAEITIDSQGELSSGVTVYYSIDTSEGESNGTEETVLAPIGALCSYDDGYYLIVQADKKPDGAIDPEEVGGSVTDYPKGYYAVPVEVGSYNGSYIQILSGAEQEQTVFLRYQNAAPSGGNSTSNVDGDSGQDGMPDFGGSMPDFSGGSMPSFGGGSSGGGNRGSGGMPGGGMPSFG